MSFKLHHIPAHNSSQMDNGHMKLLKILTQTPQKVQANAEEYMYLDLLLEKVTHK